MSDNNSIALRRKKRYSHIYISLSVKVGFQWQQTKALDWNEDGFNFFVKDELPYANILFKKGLAKFAGKLKWCRRSDDTQFNLEMMLNTFLYEEINREPGKNTMFDRIVRLIRTEGMIDEKKKLLAVMNADITDHEIERRVREQACAEQIYRYGVKVSSPEWSEIVKYALETSSVVDAIDKVGKGLSDLANSMEQEDP